MSNGDFNSEAEIVFFQHPERVYIPYKEAIT